MEFRVVQIPDCLEIQAPMSVGSRIFFLILALFPLLAPYELILHIRWTDYWSFFFLLAAIISAGAIVLSAFLLWAAIAGLSTGMRFDKARGVLIYTAEAPVVPRRSETFPLDAIAELRVETHDWSDGSPSYALEVVLRDGRELSLGSAWSRMEVESVREKVMEYLQRSS